VARNEIPYVVSCEKRKEKLEKVAYDSEQVGISAASGCVEKRGSCIMWLS
jgi:hypothetical protein